jgi:hypothetical protein
MSLRQPLCPYCHHPVKDAWEIDFGNDMNGNTDIECAKCGELYNVEREVTVEYSVSKTTNTPMEGEL